MTLLRIACTALVLVGAFYTSHTMDKPAHGTSEYHRIYQKLLDQHGETTMRIQEVKKIIQTLEMANNQ